MRRPGVPSSTRSNVGIAVLLIAIGLAILLVGHDLIGAFDWMSSTAQQ